jgi:hypothetical protein
MANDTYDNDDNVSDELSDNDLEGATWKTRYHRDVPLGSSVSL